METLYEAMLIVEPGQSDDELSATIEEAKSIIARADGKVESAYPVFRRRLAYPIEDRTEGTYVLVYFRGSRAVDELKRDLQMSTAILRVMVVQANPLALWLEGPPHAPAPQRRGERAETPDSPKPDAAESKAESATPDEPEAPADAEPEAAPEAPAEAESATPDEPEAPAEAEPEAAPEEPPQEEDGAESSEAAPEDESPQQDASS